MAWLSLPEVDARFDGLGLAESLREGAGRVPPAETEWSDWACLEASLVLCCALSRRDEGSRSAGVGRGLAPSPTLVDMAGGRGAMPASTHPHALS